MKAIPAKIRLPRKILILTTGILLLSGASGALAVYVGKDALLGPSKAEISGVACQDVQTIKLEKNGQRWVRKFIKTTTVDGLIRVKTALRVAAAYSRTETADLYHVIVLDENGPVMRADMRARAIGAEAFFTPHPGTIPGMSESFMAHYIDGMPNDAGQFYGEKISVPIEDIKGMVTAMEDKSDCFSVDGLQKAAEGRGEVAATH